MTNVLVIGEGNMDHSVSQMIQMQNTMENVVHVPHVSMEEHLINQMKAIEITCGEPIDIEPVNIIAPKGIQHKAKWANKPHKRKRK